MDISLIKKTTVTLLSLVAISCAATNETPTSSINFKSMAGTGNLIKKSLEENTTRQLGQARLSLIKNMTIRQEQNCQGLSLSTQTKTIVVVGDCPSGQYFVCPGGADSCKIKGLNQTQRHNQIYEYKSDFSDINYVVELYPDKMIYRIQESNCIISYPHDCLIKALGWKDVEYLEFIRNL